LNDQSHRSHLQRRLPQQKKAKTPEKLPYEKSEEKVIAMCKADVKQWFAKLNQKAKERRNPHLYVKPEELRKKVADHQKKQWEAQ